MNGNDSREFKKRCQLIIGARDKPLSIVAMCVNNPHRSRLGIEWLRHSPSPSGFLEVRQGTFRPDRCGRPAQGTLIHISIAVPLFLELRRVGSVERGEKCTTKGRKIR
jgi:hypothetical protein